MLAELVQAQIDANGWKSRDPLIRLSGLSQAFFSKLMNREIINPTVQTVDSLANALGLPAEQVFLAALADVRAARLAATETPVAA